jgi:hypothetical protein
MSDTLEAAGAPNERCTLEASAAKEASDGSQVHWHDAKKLESEGKAIDALSVHYSGACTIFSSGVREI